MMKQIIVILSVLTSFNSLAKDFGVFGELFPVSEKNLINVIKERLSDIEDKGGFETLKNEMQQKAIDRLERPIPVLTQRVQLDSQRLFDPTVTLTKDLKDDKGRIFAYKGDTINPLSHIVFGMTLYFIDSDDQSQIKWLTQQKLLANDKIILTNGNPQELENRLDRRVYFDQNSQLIKRFNIVAVPSVVYRQGNYLLIKEVAVNE